MAEPCIDLFAGAGGFELAARELGLDPLGIEWSDSACAIREAAGLRTLQADVAALDPLDFAPVVGLIGGPPCPAFSSAGKGEGRDAMPFYVDAIRRMGEGEQIDRAEMDAACGDERAHLVLEPLCWALALTPRWIALEQVPPVLPLWEAMADVLRSRGYSVAVDILSAEQFGVPQTRKRAFLIASLDGPVSMPRPTHQRYFAPRRRDESVAALFEVPEPGRIVLAEDVGLLPWVSMAQALGWGLTARPCISLTAGSNRQGGPDPLDGGSGARQALHDARARGDWVVQTNNFTAVARDPDGKRSKAGSVPYERDVDDPAPTVDTTSGGWHIVGQARTSGPGAARPPRDIGEPSYTLRANAGGGSEGTGRSGGVEWVTEEAACLQSFPEGFPWMAAGSKTAAFMAIGNAVPVLLALAVLRVVCPISHKTHTE